MNDDSINEDNAIFERPDMAMQQHLKPIYIRVKVRGVGLNKVLVDCGAYNNLMAYSLLRKFGKYDTDLKPNNMVLSNYEGNTNKP